jgi:hypothetical protein
VTEVISLFALAANVVALFVLARAWRELGRTRAEMVKERLPR